MKYRAQKQIKLSSGYAMWLAPSQNSDPRDLVKFSDEINFSLFTNQIYEQEKRTPAVHTTSVSWK